MILLRELTEKDESAFFTGLRDQVAARVKDRWCLAYTPGSGDVVVQAVS